MPASLKKIIIVALGTAVVGAGIYFIRKGARQTSYHAENAQLMTETQSAILEKDGDGDGLKDWEEQLWKTDPWSPDTAGDGMPDGMKVKQGRNPLLAGPNNKLDDATVAAKINTVTEGDLSETDKFSRELFIKIIADKNNNTQITGDELQTFLNNAIAQETQDQKLKNFTAGDFQSDTVETPDKVRVYGNAIAGIFTKKPPAPLEYEVDVVNRAETDNDPAELKKLEPLIAEYRRIENDLLQTAVPQSALSYHVALTNAVAGMIWSITGLEYIMTDPVKALPGVAAYAQNVQNFSDSINNFKNYFNSQNTFFESGDPGLAFFGNPSR